MKPSEIYRAAAKNMEQGRNTFACHAIEAVGGNEEDHCERMKALFSSTEDATYAWLAVDKSTGERDICPVVGNESFNWRIVALCFMAAIAEDEERSMGLDR